MASSLGAGKVITDGLVLFLDAGNNRSYPGTGTTWTDLSSTAITGSLTNGPTFNTGNGGSIVFDGTNDYCLTGYSANPTYFTIECFLKFNDVSGIKVAFGKYNGSGDDYWVGIYNTSDILFSAKNNIMFSGVTANTSSYYLVHAVLGQNERAIYINGVKTNTSSSISLNPNGDVTIGTFGTSQTFYSSINVSNFKIYNRALTSDEVLQN